MRLQPDGRAAPDNPFVGQAGALPEIWSFGHRSVQSAALHPTTKELWVVEHGARGGDEINIARRGRDYGWPTISYGIEGDKIGDGIAKKDGMEQPLYYWVLGSGHRAIRRRFLRWLPLPRMEGQPLRWCTRGKTSCTADARR